MTVNPFSIPPFLSMIVILLIAIIVIFHNVRSSTNQFFSFFCLSACGWLFGYSVMYNCNDDISALFWARVGFSFIAFIPVLAFHFVQNLLNKKRRLALLILYLTIPFAIYYGWTEHIYKGVARYFWGYYPIAGNYYIFFLLLFIVSYSACVLQTFYGARQARLAGQSIKAQQLKFVSYAFLFGITALVDYIVKYKVPIYPFGYISALLFILVIAYAIVKYRLMDIRVAVTSASLFLGVYALALGVPFYLHVTGHKTLALSLAIILATVAPFLYFHLRRRAEDKIFAEEREYQEILQKTAKSFTQRKTVSDISSAIVEVIGRTIQPVSAAVYFLDGQDYVLKDTFGTTENFTPKIAGDSAVAAYLKTRDALILDEFRRGSVSEEKDVAEFFKNCPAQVVLPIKGNEKLFGFLLIGEKRTNAVYSERDLAALNNFAFPVGLAIENALYVEDLERTQEKLVESEKMATIGFLVGGLAHQLKNRLTPLVFNAEFASRKVQKSRETPMSSADCD
ncbi:MAG: GAF domain-containing protein, partial [Candidatus Omnitrophica bacterium]|nr:GAF domain-containing protein [Candidatus Omnitrophota bacterium]